MKKLFLIRHASANKIQGQEDILHHLDKAGLSDAEKLGQYIRQLPVKVGKIFCSVAVRTRETAQEIVKELNYNPTVEFSNRIYNASDEALLRFIEELDDKLENIAIIGHNPSITTVMNLIRPKCGIEFAKVAFNQSYTAKMVLLTSNAPSWTAIAHQPCEIYDVFHP